MLGDFNREALRIGIDTRPPAARVVRALAALVEVRGKPANFPDFVRDDMIDILDHFAPESLDFITTGHTLELSLAPHFQLLGLPLTTTAHRNCSNK